MIEKDTMPKIVELGEYITAPFCSKVWADVGAEVIKIEKPVEGDKSRKNGPFPNDEPHLEKSGLFLYLNSNKKSITLDIRKPEGREILKELLKETDIFIENNPPKLMRELGLNYASLQEEFPSLIMVSITPFGQTGPYRDYKGHCLNHSALSRFLFPGSPNREPLDHAMSFADYTAGYAGATASMIVFYERYTTGKGRHCDIASFQNMINNYSQGSLDMWKRGGVLGGRLGRRITDDLWFPSVILPVKDGDYLFVTFEYSHWKRFMDILGNPEWSKDPRFNFEPEMEAQGTFLMAPHTKELEDLLANEVKDYTKAELFEKCFEAKIPFVPVMDIEDMVNSPQTKFRNEIVEIDHPVAGKQKYPISPANISDIPIEIKHPAPLLGQHSREIYCDGLGYTDSKIETLKKAGII